MYCLYVHIPYCHSRCRYCDFYTAGASRAVPDAYVDALLRDFARHAPKKTGGGTQRPHTVYFGGGTPGLLSAAQLARLLAAFCPLPGAEITLETNPELATVPRLAAARKAGVNRLSIGVQTASDEGLKQLGRLHTAAGAAAALRSAHEAGFENVTGDMMLALPGYTRQEIDNTLELLSEGGAVHISAYLLKVEPGTPFAQCPPAGLPGDDAAAGFYLYAVQKLEEAGFAQYEISNFAKPGFEGRHNLLYWNCENYLGLGPAAHSCMGGRRFSFGHNTAAFLQDALPPSEEGRCTADDYIMLQLRLNAGLCEGELARRYGIALTGEQRAFMERLMQAGFARKTDGGWCLTPSGMLVQNNILAGLL